MRLIATFLLTIGLSLAMSISGSATVAGAAEQAVTPAASQPDDLELPIYTPPKKITPRARVGGALRGTEDNEPEIVALVPDHVGLTVKQTPTLNWFLSKPTAYPLKFTLIDNRSIQPLHEGPIPTPAQPGIQSIELKALRLTLEPEIQYRWYVSAVRNSDSHSQDIVAGGVIERCEFNSCVTTTTAVLTCDQQSVLINAIAGFWYDAMSCICELIRADPNNPSLIRMRAALLKQVGLDGVAEWDLRSIQNLGR